MPDIGPMELVVVLIIALVVLGPKRLPEAGRGIGKGIREFKDSLSGTTEPKPELTKAEAAPAAETKVETEKVSVD